jgi:predicted dehydrogenase
MNIGIVGCGGIGQLRAQALKEVPEVKLRQVYDLDHERMELFSRQYSCPTASDWQALINNPDLDAIIISTPPSSHQEIAVGALKAGKNVLCEKPLARTPDECREIVNAGEIGNIFVATGFNYRFFPSITKTKEILDSGMLGELEYVRSYAGYSAADHSQAWHHDANIIGGGTLWDNGIHLIDLTRYFLAEEVTEVMLQIGFGDFKAVRTMGLVCSKPQRGRQLRCTPAGQNGLVINLR